MANESTFGIGVSFDTGCRGRKRKILVVRAYGIYAPKYSPVRYLRPLIDLIVFPIQSLVEYRASAVRLSFSFSIITLNVVQVINSQQGEKTQDEHGHP